jgi:phosphoglycolate phosphatase
MLTISETNGEIVQIKPEIILFDKDGTLIDIHHYWSNMLRLRSKMIIAKWFSSYRNKIIIEEQLLESMGLDTLTGKIKTTGPVGIKPRKYIVNAASQVVRSNGIRINNFKIEEIFQDVDKATSKEMAPLLKLLPGVSSLLKQLADSNISMALVSTDITSRARLAMETLKIDHFFTDIIGGDLVENTKPSPDLAIQVSKNTGIKIKKMMVIGDNPVDIKMGLSANIKFNLAVLTGLSNLNSFKKLNCMIINNLKSIEVK